MNAEHLRNTQQWLADVRKHCDALKIERDLLKSLFDAVEWLSDPEGTILGLNPGPEQAMLQKAYDDARAYYEDAAATAAERQGEK